MQRKYFMNIATVLLLLSFLVSHTQAQVPSVATDKDTIAVYIDGKKENFPQFKQNNPMHFTLPMDAEETLSIVSETDSIAFTPFPNETLVFDVVRTEARDTLNCFFTIVEKLEPTSFSEDYKLANKGKTIVEIPRLYELVNVIYAMTPTGKTDRDIVRQGTPYHTKVLSHFESYGGEPVVRLLDSLLREGKYNHLKMDAYAFDFKEGHIRKKKTYAGFWGNYNHLKPYTGLLEDFSRKSGFADFYDENENLYQKQIAAYRDSNDVDRMRTWLEKQFPSVRYDVLKIIFSPLVNGNQSSWNYEDDGFRELQAHVNYPYPGSSVQRYPKEVRELIWGIIVFTEINHGYIDPESKKPRNIEKIERALKDRSGWIEADKPSRNYDSPFNCFNEYMNWGLVNLYHMDNAPKEFWEELNDDIVKMMTGYRGFTKFPEFNEFLVELYLRRQENRTLSDLYPEIIAWFEWNQ